MRTQDKVSKLFNEVGSNVQIGKSFKFLSKGWLQIADQDDTWSIVSSTNKNFNRAVRGGPGILGLKLSKNSNGAIAMIEHTSGWIKNEQDSWWAPRNLEVNKKLIEIMTKKIDKAYDFNL